LATRKKPSKKAPKRTKKRIGASLPTKKAKKNVKRKGLEKALSTRQKKLALAKAEKARNKRNASRRKKYAQNKKLKEAIKKQKDSVAIPESIQTVLQSHAPRDDKKIITSAELLTLKLIEGLEKAQKKNEIGVPYDDMVLWRSIEPTEGYHIAAHLNMLFNSENEEEIIYRIMKAAKIVEAAANPNDLLYSSMWFYEYGSEIIGSHKPSMFISPDGEIAGTVQGTVGVNGIKNFEQLLRRKIETLLDAATRGAVFIHYATVRTYTPFEVTKNGRSRNR